MDDCGRRVQEISLELPTQQAAARRQGLAKLSCVTTAASLQPIVCIIDIHVLWYLHIRYHTCSCGRTALSLSLLLCRNARLSSAPVDSPCGYTRLSLTLGSDIILSSRHRQVGVVPNPPPEKPKRHACYFSPRPCTVCRMCNRRETTNNPDTAVYDDRSTAVYSVHMIRIYSLGD